MEPAVFQETMDNINEIFDEAERLSCRNISEGCLACVTGYVIHYCFKTHYEQVREAAIVVARPSANGLTCLLP